MRRGLGLLGGEAPGVMRGLRGHCPSGHIKEEMGCSFCWRLLPNKDVEESRGRVMGRVPSSRNTESTGD